MRPQRTVQPSQVSVQQQQSSIRVAEIGHVRSFSAEMKRPTSSTYRVGTTSKRMRRLFHSLLFLSCFIFLIHLAVIRLAPTGYSQLPCFLTENQLRKSEVLLEKFSKVARVHNFTWWADYGLLLGITRDGSLIPYDKDMDGSYWEQDGVALQRLRPHLKAEGLALHGGVVIWAEDSERFKKSEDERELVVNKLELHSVRSITGPPAQAATTVTKKKKKVIPSSALKFSQSNSFLDQIWWFLLQSFGVTIHDQGDILPLTNATLKKRKTTTPLKSNITEVMKTRPQTQRRNHSPSAIISQPKEPAVRILPPPPSSNIDNIPVPHNAQQILQDKYGLTWKTPLKWKLRCYTG